MVDCCTRGPLALIALLPAVRVTQVRPLALFGLGMRWAGRVNPRSVAAALPVAVADASTEHRRRRWRRNPRVSVPVLWHGLLPALLRAGQPRRLVLDPTPPNAAATIRCLGSVCRRRVWPGAWRVVVQNAHWSQPQIT